MILSSMSAYSASVYADDFQFNTDLLDVTDKKNIELGLFSKPGYIMPGDYAFKVNLNNQYLTDRKIKFLPSKYHENKTEACLSEDFVEKFGLIKEIQKRLQWDNETDCLVLDSIPGMTVKGDLPKATAHIHIPQAYLEYRSENWDPSSLWDEGINGAIFDYNLAANTSFGHQSNQPNSTFISANGVTGLNLSAWRVRADWQANYQHVGIQGQKDKHDFSWNRFYAYRALPSLKSQLMIGENYLNSDLFDSFRFTGASLRSDINMLPPRLRGYAPEVTGVAQTNAKVVVSQLGRVLYQTQVPAGPFRIQDLNDSVSGTLNVRVEEEDGTVREFNVETASIPFLTRPGAIRYKATVGRPTTYNHEVEGDLFFTGEFSWGVTNGWSLIGGSLNSKDYNALSVGVGRDLLSFGAVSFDITQSFAKFEQQKNLQGRSYRLNYAKRFEEMNSQIQFAGYRFSERDFVSMSDFLAYNGATLTRYGRSKEMYSVSLSQNLPNYKTSISVNLNHQTYWESKDRDYYTLSINKTLDIGAFRNSNLSLSAYQNKSDTKDTGAYLSLSLPLDTGARLSYSLSHDDFDTRNQVSYFDRLNNTTSYQFNATHSQDQASSFGAFVSHTGGRIQASANINYVRDRYTSIGASSQGGITLTARGIDFHRSNAMGGTRVMIDTEKTADIPVSANGQPTNSNYFGKVVVTDVSNYTRNSIKVDINKLPKNAEVTDSVLQASLTEGAIGYRKLNVVSGQKKLITLSFDDGSFVPFGTPVMNNQGRSVGMVDDNGLAYLGGIKVGEQMFAHLGNGQTCSITFTENNLAKAENDALICK